MIAPLRKPDVPRSPLRRNLRRARRAVADAMLTDPRSPSPSESVGAVKSWLLAAWVVTIVVSYAVLMSGWLPLG
jgi:hypothetical protein